MCNESNHHYYFDVPHTAQSAIALYCIETRVCTVQHQNTVPVGIDLLIYFDDLPSKYNHGHAHFEMPEVLCSWSRHCC